MTHTYVGAAGPGKPCESGQVLVGQHRFRNVPEELDALVARVQSKAPDAEIWFISEPTGSQWGGHHISMLAMLLAITSLGGQNATKEITNANIAASDAWNFYRPRTSGKPLTSWRRRNCRCSWRRAACHPKRGHWPRRSWPIFRPK